MAASGFTPIQLYYSGTATNVPTAGNLAFGELAINITDGRLYFKNPSNVVIKIADAAAATGSVVGGTAGALVYQSAPSTSAFINIGTNGFVLTSNGTVPVYTNPASITVGTATTATNLAGGAANRIAYQTGAGATGFAVAPTVIGTVLGWTGSAFAWVSAPAATSATNLAGGGANTVVYQSAAGTTAYLTNGTTGQVLTATTGGAPTWGSGVSNLAGGTAGQVAYQSGPGATAFAGPGTTGQPLISNGATAPTFGTLGVSGGGTGRATLTANSLLVGNGAAAVSLVAPGATGNILTSNGTSWASAAPPVAGPSTAKTYYMAQF